MTKDKFKDNFKGAIDALMELTSVLSTNTFFSKYRFMVRPNAVTVDSHLDQEEILFHNQIMTFKDMYLSNKEVVELLWASNKVPLWINTSVGKWNAGGNGFEDWNYLYYEKWGYKDYKKKLRRPVYRLL